MPSFCLGTPQVRNSFGHLSSFKTGVAGCHGGRVPARGSCSWRVATLFALPYADRDFALALERQLHACLHSVSYPAQSNISGCAVHPNLGTGWDSEDRLEDQHDRYASTSLNKVETVMPTGHLVGHPHGGIPYGKSLYGKSTPVRGKPGRKAEAAEIRVDAGTQKSLDENQWDEGGGSRLVDARSRGPESYPVGETVPEMLPKETESALEGSVVQTCPGRQCAQNPRRRILCWGIPSSPPG